MKIIKFPEIDGYSNVLKVFALGKFESIHLGHRKIFETARDIADKNNLEFGIMIFDERENNNVYSLAERLSFIKEYEPDYIMLFERKQINFNVSWNEFNFFLKNINVKEVVIGEDFSYGKNRKGNFETFDNIKCNVVEDILIDNKKVSTTRIIDSIRKSNFIKYRKYLNHYFFYNGKIIKGKGNGKKIGTPTANVDYPKYKIDIEDGIYYSYIIWDGKRMPSLTSISYNPTFNGDKKTYETFIYNFDKDIYGEEVYVEIIEKIRDPIKFSSIDELIEKMSDDKENGKKYFDLL